MNTGILNAYGRELQKHAEVGTFLPFAKFVSQTRSSAPSHLVPDNLAKQYASVSGNLNLPLQLVHFLASNGEMSYLEDYDTYDEKLRALKQLDEQYTLNGHISMPHTGSLEPNAYHRATAVFQASGRPIQDRQNLDDIGLAELMHKALAAPSSIVPASAPIVNFVEAGEPMSTKVMSFVSEASDETPIVKTKAKAKAKNKAKNKVKTLTQASSEMKEDPVATSTIAVPELKHLYGHIDIHGTSEVREQIGDDILRDSGSKALKEFFTKVQNYAKLNFQDFSGKRLFLDISDEILFDHPKSREMLQQLFKVRQVKSYDPENKIFVLESSGLRVSPRAKHMMVFRHKETGTEVYVAQWSSIPVAVFASLEESMPDNSMYAPVDSSLIVAGVDQQLMKWSRKDRQSYLKKYRTRHGYNSAAIFEDTAVSVGPRVFHPISHIL